MQLPADPLSATLARIEAAAAGRTVRLVAISKTRGADEVRALAARGQRAFGENYVQEALAKRTGLEDLPLEWHLVGPLQSNKCADAARRFDWLQSLDRLKLVAPLARHRPAALPPLNVLVQVDIDEEPTKSGCRPDEVDALCDAVASHATLALRGLMAIPAPHPDLGARRRAFARMRTLHEAVRTRHPGADTLSMGMSDDYVAAIEEGATMVRIGTALFGPRSPR